MKAASILTVILLVVCINPAISGRNYYVNPPQGNNLWDGLAPFHTSGNHGPKATIQSAVNAAMSQDTVNMVEQWYNESLIINKSLTVCCTGSPSLRSLTVRDNSQVSIHGTLEITASLTITAGVISVEENQSLIITNGSSSAVHITSGSIKGAITRTIELYSTCPYIFTDANTTITPGGTSSPAGVNCTALVTILSAQGQQPPSFAGGQAINRYYQITTDPPIQATLRLAYLESELNGISEGSLSAFCWTQSNSNWILSGGVVDPSNNYIELSTLTLDSLSKWTLGDPSHPLPIQLASFSATVSGGNDVRLDWRTLSETNNYGFFIQRRIPPSEAYVDVENSFVPGHGTTLEPHDYSWTQSQVAPGSYYYRLKQVDLDGSFHFSDSRQVIVYPLAGVEEGSFPASFNLSQNYPNPFNPSTRIQFTVDRSGSTTLTVSDILGKEVETLFAGTAEAGTTYGVTFDASRVANGTYFYRLVSGNQVSLKKMLLLK